MCVFVCVFVCVRMYVCMYVCNTCVVILRLSYLCVFLSSFFSCIAFAFIFFASFFFCFSLIITYSVRLKLLLRVVLKDIRSTV